MEDSRHFTAHAAAARYAGRKVSLMGRPLHVGSLHHTLFLDALLGDDWHAENLDAAALDILSQVCTEREPTGLLVKGETPVEQERYTFSLMQFDAEEQLAIWQDYYLACFASGPRIKTAGEGATRHDWKAPAQDTIAAYILRHSAGTDEDRLWKDRAYSEVHWFFETLREQVTGTSRILPDVDPPEETPEARATRQAFESLAAKVIAACSAELLALGPPTKTNAAARQLIADKQARLLELAKAGRLSDSLEELPPVAT